jgi:beta-glucosidase
MDSLLNPAYKNPELPIKDRVTDLLSRMTLTEKIAQLTGVWDSVPVVFDSLFLSDEAKMQEVFGNGVNSVQPSFAGIRQTVEQRNTIQKYLAEKTRLGIPAIFVDEGQHGLMRPESTCFPQAIGLACSWDPQLFEAVYTVVAAEMRSRGTHMALSPVIDVCRDPRWGRVEETYGEDPFLNGILGTAAVKGFQGTNNGIITPGHVAATLKHLVGHGQPEGGLNQAPANYSERILREAHMPPFKTVIDNAAPVAVMPSYNEIDGIPSHANKKLIKETLRTEWGFKGLVVSDYFAIDQLVQKHCVAADGKEAALIAFNSGVQCEFPIANYFRFLPELLAEGKIQISDIDQAASQILELKFQLGLFENPYIDIESAVNTSKKNDSRELALQSARESIVLLKNDGILPISKDRYKKIAVIGPCAKDTYFGGYSGEPYEKVSLYEGIKNKAGSSAEILFAQGCKLTTNTSISFHNWKKDEIQFATHEENIPLLKEALDIASKAELIILAIGENEHLCREAMAKNHIGDNMTLDLFGDQEELVTSIVALGKPFIAYLMNGRPLSVNYLAQHVPAIIEGWYMGQETGTAAAEIIFGDVNPSGKLTITIPKSVGQLPMFYNHKPGAQYQQYLSQDNKPLFAFGFGLSYTRFTYGKPLLDKQEISIHETVKVTVDIKNSGQIKGDEIVQLYIHDKVSSVTRPVKELKGFQRISLMPGETKNVVFEITPQLLSFYDINMDYLVEPGEFDIMIGGSSEEEKLQKVLLIVV